VLPTRRARRGVAVVADLESSDVRGFAELFGLVDHLIVRRNSPWDYRFQSSRSAVARLLGQRGRQAVVVTCGSQGAWFQEKDWRLPTFHPAFPVKVVDTTGCGDVFHGAYAAGLAKGLPLAERIRLPRRRRLSRRCNRRTDRHSDGGRGECLPATPKLISERNCACQPASDRELPSQQISGLQIFNGRDPAGVWSPTNRPVWRRTCSEFAPSRFNRPNGIRVASKPGVGAAHGETTR